MASDASPAGGPPAEHVWRPITDLGSADRQLASRELESLRRVWQEQHERLRDTEVLRTFHERLRREWAIETGVIERLYTLDEGTTELLIQHGVDASLIPRDATDRSPGFVADLICDHEAAFEWLFEVVRGGRALSVGFVKELHALMTRHQATTEAVDQFGRRHELPLLHGEFKQLPNNPRRGDGTVHEYSPPEHVAAEMDRLVDLHRAHEEQGVAPELEAAWLHHRFAQIHPFQDGNGRVVRALASLVLIQRGSFPLVVTRRERVEYLSALRAADEGDLGALVGLVARLQRAAFLQALRLSEAVIREGDRIEQVITAAAEMLSQRQREELERLDRAKRTAEDLRLHALARFQAVRDRLEAELGGSPVGIRAFVDGAPDDAERRAWNRWQVVQTANELDYFANLREFAAWVRLGITTDTRTEILLSFHAIGQEFRGLVAATVTSYRREEAEDGTRLPVDHFVASDELFQVNYVDEPHEALERFRPWLEAALVRALDTWRRGL